MYISVFGFKFNLEVLILIGVIYLILVINTFSSCSRYGLLEGFEVAKEEIKEKIDELGGKPKPVEKTNKEGFVGSSLNNAGALYDPVPDISKWGIPEQSHKNSEKRPKQEMPLPEGEMLIFANTKFSPEYCPGTYSTSSGS